MLGAVEGVRELNPAFHELVVPVSAAILIGLFWVQKVGTH
ncbi:MAG: KUP/HAK/KT family potassium transporter, partial [Kofleriaceae bacterium]